MQHAGASNTQGWRKFQILTSALSLWKAGPVAWLSSATIGFVSG